MAGADRDKRILEEFLRRGEDEPEEFSIDTFCFKEQRDFINDPSRFKVAVCGRRSGKTVACAADLIATCLAHERVNCLYITLSRGNAKRIIWRELKSINRHFDLEGHVHESELSIDFPNGSTIWLSGAKDSMEIEKFRGMKLKKVYIDEAQAFRGYINSLINEVLTPTTWDDMGSIIMIGTPGPVPVGPLHDAFHNINDFRGYSRHGWNALKNPYIDAETVWKEDIKRKGITRDDPTFQRENLGKWVMDREALVFKFEGKKNVFDLADFNADLKWSYVIGIDTGFHDADAIAVLAFSEGSPNVYMVDESIKDKQGVSPLMDTIRKMQDAYNPVSMVIDSAAGGRKMAEEYHLRYGVFLESAEKTRKHEFIELMNDDLRTGRLQIKRGFQACEDMLLVQWNRNNPAKPRIDDGFHSDILDALLYGWREARHFFYTPEQHGPKLYTNQWWQEEARRMEAAEVEALEKRESDTWWEEGGDDGSSFLWE